MDSKKKRNKVSANFDNKINAEKKRNKVNSCLRPSLTLILTISLKMGSMSSSTPRSLPSSIESLFPSSTSILTSRLTLSLMPRSTSSLTCSSMPSLTAVQIKCVTFLVAQKILITFLKKRVILMRDLFATNTRKSNFCHK